MRKIGDIAGYTILVVMALLLGAAIGFLPTAIVVAVAGAAGVIHYAICKRIGCRNLF